MPAVNCWSGETCIINNLPVKYTQQYCNSYNKEYNTYDINKGMHVNCGRLRVVLVDKAPSTNIRIWAKISSYIQQLPTCIYLSRNGSCDQKNCYAKNYREVLTDSRWWFFDPISVVVAEILFLNYYAGPPTENDFFYFFQKKRPILLPTFLNGPTLLLAEPPSVHPTTCVDFYIWQSTTYHIYICLGTCFFSTDALCEVLARIP